MAGFTHVAWVDSSITEDHLACDRENDISSMVPIVEEILKCGESFDKSSKSSSYAKLREYIRRGLPAVLRPNTWRTLCNSKKVVENTPGLFNDIQQDFEYALFTESGQYFNAGFIRKHFLTEDGWKNCQEVLAVLSKLNCDVMFCPILQHLVCIFMHFMCKEDCFACMDYIFSSKKHGLDKSATAYCLTAKTFQDALKTWKKPVYAWFKLMLKENHDIKTKREIFFVHWLQWIFKYLDFWTLVHILDNYLLDGEKIFYRVGLVTFEQVYNECKKRGKLKDEELEALFSEVVPTRFGKSSDLINRALKIPGVSRKILAELRQKNIIYEKSGLIKLPEIETETLFRGVVEGSDLLSSDQVQDLFAAFPRRVRQLCKLTCVFSTEVDGTSLTSFYRKSEATPCTVLVVKTTKQEIFGAFLSTPWNERFNHSNSFFGNGETFLFRFYPHFIRYTWCGLRKKAVNTPAFFMLADSQRIVVGGGNGWGLSIESDLTRGRSQKCDTFENEPLSSGSDGEFECVRVEVWGLQEMGHLTTYEDSFKERTEPPSSLCTDDL